MAGTISAEAAATLVGGRANALNDENGLEPAADARSAGKARACRSPCQQFVHQNPPGFAPGDLIAVSVNVSARVAPQWPPKGRTKSGKIRNLARIKRRATDH